MTSKERVLAALAGEQPDRTPIWLGHPRQEVIDRLIAHYGVADHEAMLRAAGDDFRWITQGGYVHPEWGPCWAFRMPPEASAAACETVAEVDALPWPDVENVPIEGLAEKCDALSDCALMGGTWAPFFHEVGWLIGQEEYFVKMHTHPEVVEAITDHMVDFHIATNDRIFDVIGDRLDFYFFGNDLGTQLGPFIGPEQFRRFILPGFRRLVAHAHARGLKAWLHSCGSVRSILTDLIDIGVDALHPVQVSAAGMDVEELGREYGEKLLFVGGIDVHHLLRRGTTDEVREAVRHNKKHLAPRYVVSPSHEAILPDVKTENLVAMIDEAKAG